MSAAPGHDDAVEIAGILGRRKRKRPVTVFGFSAELGVVLEIIPEISPGLPTELSDYGADGDHYGRRTPPAVA